MSSVPDALAGCMLRETTIAPTGKEVPVRPFELSNQDLGAALTGALSKWWWSVTVALQELHIPPHEYRYVKVRFTPQAGV